jgi:hypothetical protein
MRTHATSRIGETGLKIFNGFLIFLNSFPIFLNGFPIFSNGFPISSTAFRFLQRLSAFFNGFPIFLNGFPLSEKSKKIYLRRQVYKRSPFELRISRHSLPELRNHHSLPELCNCHSLPKLCNCHLLPELRNRYNACISPNTRLYILSRQGVLIGYQIHWGSRLDLVVADGRKPRHLRTGNSHEVSGQFTDDHLDLFMGGFAEDTCEDGMRHLGIYALGRHCIGRHHLGGTGSSAKGRCLVGSNDDADDANEKSIESSVLVFGMCCKAGHGYAADDGNG